MASGVNTGGRKKGLRNKTGRKLRGIAKRYTEEAVEYFVDVIRDAGSPLAAILAAATALLDRGHGKPAQAVDRDVTDSLPREQLMDGRGRGTRSEMTPEQAKILEWWSGPQAFRREMFGLSVAVSVHYMQHAHVSHALDLGAPAHLAQATVGHRDLRTTSRYAHARPNESSSTYLMPS